MLRFNRTAVVKNGADAQRALGYAAEVTAYVNTHYDIDLQFGIEMFNQNRIHWSADFASLAEFEEKFTKLMSDSDYFALLEGGRAFWVDGSLQDVVYQTIG